MIAANESLNQQETAQGKVRLDSTPPVIQVEITNHCNLSCGTCARNYWDDRLNPVGHVLPQVIERLEPFLHRASAILPFGYGESMVSPEFPAALRRLRRINGHAVMTLFTNGTSFGDEGAQMLVECGVDHLCFSMDGGDDQTLRQTRGVTLNALTHSIRRVTQLRQQAGSPHPRLSASLTLTRRNLHSVPALVELAAKVGLERVGIAFARIFTPGQQADSLLLTADRLAEAMDVLHRAHHWGMQHGVAVELPSLAAQCRQPFRSLFVKWDGEARLCCASAIVTAQPIYIRVGNVLHTPLDTLWNAPLAQEVRAGLLPGGTPHAICGQCPFGACTLDTLSRFQHM